jgi:hypothetical protein
MGKHIALAIGGFLTVAACIVAVHFLGVKTTVVGACLGIAIVSLVRCNDE